MDIFQFGEFQLDAVTRTMKRQQEVLVLNGRAFDVLLYLVQNPGRVISKDELLKNVWSDAVVDENNLAQNISTLRRVMTEKRGENGYIRTVPGQGYRFACAVSAVAPVHDLVETGLRNHHPAGSDALVYHEETVRTTTVTEEKEETTKASRRSRRRVWILAGSVLGVAIIAATTVLAWRHYHRIPQDPIVVLAEMENTTGEAGLSEVLTSAVATDLKQSPYLNFLSPVHVQDTLAQMQLKKDVALTPGLAREVCLRNNAQVMLHGVIAKLGNRYLLTLDATDCVSGDTLTSSKAEAVTANEISHAIDTAAANIRRKLGESRSSIHRFDTPLFAANTGSFEALRSYSNARRLTSMGKWADSIPMFQRAIELDPKFAIGYADMASAYLNVGDRAHQAAYLTKAYELRDSANEPDRFYIVAMYHDAVTGNAEEELRNFRTWTSLYPQNGTAQANMANLYTQLGQAESAIAPAKRDLELNPDSAVSYVILGRALLHAGQLKAAQSICGQAMSKGLDGDDLHSLLLQADIALNDEAAVAGQIEWGRSRPSATRMRLNEGLLAFSRGKIQQGQDVFSAIAFSYKEQGLTRLYAVHLLASSRILADTGHLKEARKLLDSQPPPDGVMDPLVAMAETGRSDQANKILSQELAKHPEDTLWTAFRAPQIRAAALLAAHKPQEAVEALRPAMPYELRTLEIPYLRGTAYLEALQPAAAEREFRKLIEHRSVDPLSYLYALSHLGLARALANENKPSESQAAYEKFFALWKDADSAEPLLKEAHLESAALNR